MVAAATSAALFIILLWEALRGRSVVAHDAQTLAPVAIWALLTAVAIGWVERSSRNAANGQMGGMPA